MWHTLINALEYNVTKNIIQYVCTYTYMYCDNVYKLIIQVGIHESVQVINMTVQLMYMHVYLPFL